MTVAVPKRPLLLQQCIVGSITAGITSYVAGLEILRCGVLLEMSVAQLIERVRYCVSERSVLVRMLNRAHTVYLLTPLFTMIHFNIIL